MTASQSPDDATAAPRRRGDRQRQAIVNAVRELLQESPFDDLSVSTISDRAGVARSGFYFYFDSKYAVLAQILGEAQQELEELTHHFAPREPDELPAAFAKRMVHSAAVIFANNDPIMSACMQARATDAEIRRIQDDQIGGIIERIVKIVQDERAAGTARPISDDLPMLIRALSATTVMALSGESSFVGADEDTDRVVAVLEQLWLVSLWGGATQ